MPSSDGWFKPGNKLSVNRRNRAAIPLEVKQAWRENLPGLVKLVARYCTMTHEDAQRRLDHPETLQLEEMIQGTINKAKEGDVACLKFILEVFAGKLPELNAEEFTEEDLKILDKIKEHRLAKEAKQIDSDE